MNEDFNATVGNDHDSQVAGKYDLGEQNEKGASQREGGGRGEFLLGPRYKTSSIFLNTKIRI